jgi:hypothetical protein
VRIFDPVKQHKKWLFASGLRPIENLLRRVVRFCGNEGDHTLVGSARRQAIECRRRFDVNRDPLRLRQLNKIVELPIGTEDKKPLQGPRASPQGFTHSVEPIDQFRLTIASTGWCRLACPR